ncbi:MAG: GNAT family N-acetyltransferase [Acidobacteriota bacterium]
MVQVFIDESGVFSNVAGHEGAVATLAATWVSESGLPTLVSELEALKAELEIDGELKGKDLDETGTASVLDLLARHDVLACLAHLEFPARDETVLNERRRRVETELIETGLPSALASELPSISAQVVQQVGLLRELMTETTERLVGPKSLDGTITWKLDPKGRKTTSFERLVREGLLPELSDRLRRSGLTCFLEFPRSDREPGLQLADVMATAYRRALRGHLGREGWQGLLRLSRSPTATRALERLATAPRVRPVTEDDAPAIVTLLNPIIRQGSLTAITEPITVDDQLQFIRELPERATYLLAQDEGGRLLGIQDVLPGADDGTGAISTFVALDAQRHGVGRALSRATFRAALEHGHRRLTATLRSDNPGAFAFYRRQGFELVAELPGYLRLGERTIAGVKMEKTLDAA